MKYIPAFLVLLAISAAAQAALPDEPGPAPYVPGEVIVRYQSVGAVAAGAQTDGMEPRKSVVPDVHQRLRDMGLRVRRGLLDGRADLMALPSPMDVPGALRALADDPDVEYAEPNYLRYPLQTAPNDQFFGQLWGLRNTGQANFVAGGPAGVPGGDLNMLPAWDPAANGTFPRVGDASVIVAIIDEAFDTDHPDLADNFIAGRDLANDDSNPNPDSGSQEHGTLVAGSLGAIGNNGIGVAGTTWRSSLMPLKVGIAGQDGLSSAAIMDAIEYASDHGAHIINASFGGPGFSTTERNLICGFDGLFVSSAGNDDANLDFGRIGYPALYDCPNVVAAAATNRQDNIASFSMYGPLTTHVAAPGLQIVTTTIDGYATAQSNGVSGTSFSAPYISGVAALLRAHVPTTDEREIKARLIESGTAVAGANSDRRVSGGRVDAAAALDMAPRPSLTIDEITIDGDTIPHPLRPGETDTVEITLANGWGNATGVTATLSSDNPRVDVTGGPQSFGFIPGNGGEATATFPIQVSSPVGGHEYVTFTLDIQDTGGYAASRRFIREIAPLAHDGTVVTQPFQTDPGDSALESQLYDEFHTWHVAVEPGDLPSSPSGEYTLIVRTETLNDTDIDLLGRANQPPRYMITLNADFNTNNRSFFCTDSSFDCRDPNTRVSGRSDGHEAVTHVFDGAAAPEDFYFTIVNFAQAAFDYEIWSELRAGDLRPSGICPGSEELCRPDSNTLTVGGLSSGADTFVYIQRGEYSVNGAPFTENDGAAGNGDVIRVRATGASDAELTVGGISARFTPGSGPPPDPGDDDGDDDTTGMFENGGGGGGCVRTGSGQFDPLLHLLVLLAGLVLLRLPLSF
jgi:subtilisin family serine protease